MRNSSPLVIKPATMAVKCCKSCYSKSRNNWSRFIHSFLPLCSKRWPYALRWISLIVGCFGMAISGSTTTFSFWQNAMRAILNQTETESNVVITVGNIGSLIAFPGGMLYESWGCQAGVLVGGVIACSAYILLWLGTSSWKYFFAQNPLLVDTVYFFVGFGCIFTYMSSLMPNVDNFPYHQHGKIIGVLDAALSVGPTLLSVFYNTVFTRGFIKEGEEGLQDLPGFFLTMVMIYASVTVLLFFLNGRIKRLAHAKDDNADERTPILESDSFAARYESDTESASISRQDKQRTRQNRQSVPVGLEDTPPNHFSEFPFKELSITQACRRWNFIFLVMQFVLSACTQTTFQSNISTYLRSFGMSQYNLLFTVLNTTLQAITKFIAGIISDVIAERGRWPRAIVYLLPYALQTLTLFLSIFYGDNFIVLLLTCICVGAAFGATWCQTPTLVGELFGSKHLGSNWGWSMLLTAAFGFPFSIAFSSIYEAAIIQPGEIYCYGLQCFTWSFAFLSGTSLCSLIFAIGLTQNMLRNAHDRRVAIDNFKH